MLAKGGSFLEMPDLCETLFSHGGYRNGRREKFQVAGCQLLVGKELQGGSICEIARICAFFCQLARSNQQPETSALVDNLSRADKELIGKYAFFCVGDIAVAGFFASFVKRDAGLAWRTETEGDAFRTEW